MPFDAHAVRATYATVEEAFRGDVAAAASIHSLNGAWKFAFAENATVRITNFFELQYDCSAWKEIPVPAHWQLQGVESAFYVWVNGDLVGYSEDSSRQVHCSTALDVL